MPAPAVPIYVLAGQSNANNPAVSTGVMTAIAARGGLMVQHAISGSPLAPQADWGKGDWSPKITATTGEAYAGLLAQLSATFDPTKDTYIPGAYLAGVIWVQGEADAMNAQGAAVYQANITALHLDLTSRFGAHSMIIAGLSDAAGPAQDNNRHHDTWAKVQAAQAAFTAALPRAHLVDPDALAVKLGFDPSEMFKVDGVHYSWAFGKAFGEALGKALSQPAAPSLLATAPAASVAHHIGSFGVDSFAITTGGLHQVFGGGDTDSVSLASQSAGLLLVGSGEGILRVLGRNGALTVDMIGVETVALTRFADIVRLDAQALRVETGEGDDQVSGSTLVDNILLGAGNDEAWAGNGNDWLMGDAGNDYLHGGYGADGLYGGSGADMLLGGAGNDLLHGGPDNDTLTGNTGNDQLIGGFGYDVFVLSPGGGVDSIADFRDGVDRIDLRAYHTSFAALGLSASSGGAALRMADGSGALLTGVTLSQLSAADFLF